MNTSIDVYFHKVLSQSRPIAQYMPLFMSFSKTACENITLGKRSCMKECALKGHAHSAYDLVKGGCCLKVIVHMRLVGHQAPCIDQVHRINSSDKSDR